MRASHCAAPAIVIALVLAIVAPASAGGVSFLGLDRDGAGVSGLDGARALAISPDGAHVYVASIHDGAVAAFARNAATGDLTFVAAYVDHVGGVEGLRAARGVAVSPDGVHVYAVAEDDNSVVVFRRDALDGTLTPVEVQRDGVGGVDGIDHASGVAVSPDGAHVYATGEHDDAVAVFARDALTGRLTYVEIQRDGVGGVAGIHRPSAVALSPDGANVYVTGGADDGVGVFARDATTGALTFVEAQLENVGGVEGTDRANAVAVSPDGASVYVAGHDDHAVAAFARDAGTGALTFVEFEHNGGEINGLRGAFSVAVSPDGQYVFVAAENDNAVSVFRRDASTSELTFIEAQLDGKNGVDGIDGAAGVVVSPDGAHVYAVGHEDDAVAAFAVDRCGNGAVGADEQCDDGNVIAGDGCSSACRLEACAPTPAPGCRRPIHPAASRLRIFDKDADRHDLLSWRWNLGHATDVADLGDPTTTTAYILCVYDGSATPQPLLGLAAPHDGICAGVPCWKPTSAPSFQYKDKLRTPDGLTLVRVRAGADGNAKMLVEGRGTNLRLPVLPLTAPVTVQLQNTDTSVCWEAVFTAPTTNDSAMFKAKGE